MKLQLQDKSSVLNLYERPGFYGVRIPSMIAVCSDLT
jgi:hypothetical protein